MESDPLTRHRRRRRAFFSKYSSVWPSTLLHPDSYDLLDVFAIDRDELGRILNASSRIVSIFRRISTLIENASDCALLELGVPPDALGLVRTKLPGISNPVIGRMDLVKTKSSYKLLEFNVDTPGLLMETFSINSAACFEARQLDANHGGESRLASLLCQAIHAGVRHVGKALDGCPLVAMVANSKYLRDKDTAEYIVRLLKEDKTFRSEFVSLETLRADTRGLYNSSGDPIDVLLRTFPILHLCRVRVSDKSGQEASLLTCDGLQRLIEGRRLAVINQPFILALESKAVQTAVWALMSEDTYFCRAERDVINDHFIPTYLDRPADGRRYVEKPFFGDNGDSIKAMDSSGRVFEASDTSTYSDQAMVYQEYLELPETSMLTCDGMLNLRMVWSCFVVNEQSFGVTLRVGTGITDESWWVVPVGLKKRE